MPHRQEPRRWATPAALAFILSSVLLFAAVPPAPQMVTTVEEPTTTVAVDLPPVPATTVVELTTPATVAVTAERIAPMIQETPAAPPCNEAGLNCLPFYTGDPADLCAEMNFYRMQNPITAGEPRFSDQPRNWDSPRTMGIGWRESNCNNTLTNGAGRKCCGGYYQIGWANITAPGYRGAGVWSNCGITSAQDYVGNSPLQKQKSVCAAAGLYLYHSINGPYAMHPWDSYL